MKHIAQVALQPLDQRPLMNTGLSAGQIGSIAINNAGSTGCNCIDKDRSIIENPQRTSVAGFRKQSYQGLV